MILEPVMLVELKAPTEFQGTVAGDINKWVLFSLYEYQVGIFVYIQIYIYMWIHICRRKGVIVGNDQEADDSIITAQVIIIFHPKVSSFNV